MPPRHGRQLLVAAGLDFGQPHFSQRWGIAVASFDRDGYGATSGTAVLFCLRQHLPALSLRPDQRQRHGPKARGVSRPPKALQGPPKGWRVDTDKSRMWGLRKVAEVSRAAPGG